MPTALLLALLAQALPPLGPLDGAGLPPAELDRVQVGMMAPDFRFVIDRAGRVTWKFLNTDARIRAENADILEALDRIDR